MNQTRIGTRNNLRPNFQNLNAQTPMQLQNPGQVQGTDPTQTPEQAVLDKIEDLLKKFMEALQSQQAQGQQPAGSCGGGGQKAGGAEKAGQNDPMFTLEELLKQLRELAKKNPQAVQQFLAQNPQLAQMLGQQIPEVGGAGGAMGAGVGAGAPSF